MLKKLLQFRDDQAFVARNIKIVAFAIAVAGLITELIAVFDIRQIYITTTTLTIRNYLSVLNLRFFSSNLLNYTNFDTSLHLNYLNTTIYILLFLGAIFFVTSKGKETRLIRFSIAVIFIYNVFLFIQAVLSPLFYINQLSFSSFWWAFWLLTMIFDLVIIYFTYYVLFNLGKNRELDIKKVQKIGEITSHIQDSSKWQRFLHFILDTYICVFIFSGFTRVMNLSFFGNIEQLAGERATMYVFLLIARFIYYPFFEIILGATPAKLLTESRVVGENGLKPLPKTIVLRTLSRYIPFEAFSFFGKRGWHDEFTKTRVVREARIGVPGGLYWVIVPSFVFIIGVMYWGREVYRDYKSHQYYLSEHQEKVSAIEKRLNNLDTTCIIEIKDIDHSFSSEKIFLKVEEIDKDDILATIISMKDYYSKSILEIEKEYEKNRDILPKIPIKRFNLNKGYTPDYEQSNSKKRNFIELFSGSGRFEIKRIERLYCPCIINGSYGRFGDEISISFSNCGWPAKIIEIQPIEGSVKWTKDLPIEAPSLNANNYPDFYINGEKFTRGDPYKFKIVVEDSLKHIQIYLVEGHDGDRTVKLVE